MILATVAIVITAVLFVVPVFSLGVPGAVGITAALNTTNVAQNQTLRITVTEQNSLPFPNELSLAGNWRVQNLSMGPCAFDNVYPFGIAVYQGRYTAYNISSAKSILIYAPAGYFCQLDLGGTTSRFAPLQTVTDYVDLSGYWTEGLTNHSGGGVSEGILHPFIPGQYTIAAGDEWGHLKILYFEVTGIALQEFSLCASNCAYPSPHLTGFIYFGSQSPLKSLQLFVNGTDEGVQSYGGILTNFILWYKGGFQSPQVPSGDRYALRFVAVFQDNSTLTATTTTVAQ